ncbi:MAG: competence protein [Mesorhizobium sp.]|nr:MAG: competence protein [Mesorhizobium sp.]RWH35073.1 MAG: competence protein [Mesorhizobium sp.]TIR56387.1 MAG: competence protein [Mesorhizobium sp.]
MEKAMRFALVNDVRCEAAPRLIGSCPSCLQAMIAKCGNQRIRHWAHRSRVSCDTWKERETLWHRTLKDQFPAEWQEVQMRDDSGQRHIADVRTAHGLVVEFQHSHLGANERAAREAFYNNMVWVVDGTRLKRDRGRFQQGGKLLRRVPATNLFFTHTPEACFPVAWLSSTKPVFFDFEGVRDGSQTADRHVLWCLLPERVEGLAILAPIPRQRFVTAASERAWIIPGKAVIELLTTFLRRERAVAELNARAWAYASPNERNFRRARWRRRARMR